MTLEEARKYINKDNKKNIKIPYFFNKLLFIIFIFLTVLTALKTNPKLKQTFYQEVYSNNINFASIHQAYEKYFGDPLPFDIFKNNLEPVFNENLQFSSSEKYLDGVNLKTESNYLVPSLDNGIIIFIGEKEGYNKTVIMECENGVEVWYGNIDNENVKMYDYITKGSLIGEARENLYLVFMKDGNILDYENYI